MFIRLKKYCAHKFDFRVLCLTLVLFAPMVHAEALLKHEITAEIDPAQHKLSVTDKLYLPASALSGQKLYFVLHAVETIELLTPKAILHKLDTSTSDSQIPQWAKVEVLQASIPLQLYSVDLPPGEMNIELQYAVAINHAIQAGVEYARSISESPGIIDDVGVYLARESYWYPITTESLLQFDLTVKLPQEWKSVSQGKRLKSTLHDGYQIDQWQETSAQDNIYLIAAKFHEYSQKAGKVESMAFLRQADDALATKYLETTATYLEMYQSLLGPYPYEKFALVENFWETGFGMPSFTLLGSQIIRFPFILHTSYPHELLHNWWGNSVYVNYVKGNWAEGLTSYLSDHLTKEQIGQGSDYRRSALQKYTNFARSGNDFALSQFVSRFDAVTEAVGYGKTLMLFHMLRLEIGDENFRKTLQKFYQQYRFKYAEFSDIQSVAEAVSGKSLQQFFSQWVLTAGAPQLALKNSKIEKVANQYQLQFELMQVQPGEPYRLRVPVAIDLEHNDEAVWEMLELNQAQKRFSFSFPQKPLQVRVDPLFDVFRRLDVKESPAAISQLFGAEKALVVLPASAETEKYNAYLQLAQNWQSAETNKITIKKDSELSQLPADAAVWVLGTENKFTANVVDTLQEYGVMADKTSFQLQAEKLRIENNSFVFINRNPRNPELGFGLISGSTVDAVAGLARKLPHYGKYSYLVFNGDEPVNTHKGQWPILNSPLSAFFAQPKPADKKLVERSPLITPPALFSENNLMKHMNYLTQSSLKGRGLGTEELDKAAAYIAKAFADVGLKSLQNNGSYLQSWHQKVMDSQQEMRLTNVVGVLPGSDPKLTKEPLVLGAHYDHLGLGWPDVRQVNIGKVHAGADDNASGVSVLLELARVLASKKSFPRTIIFVAFTAEEANRQGSRYFVENMSPYDIKNVFAMLNLDTVGRLENNPVTVFGTGSASEWIHIFRGVGFVTGTNIKSIANDPGSSDHSIFQEHKIPAVQFFSGVNSDFHQPTDTLDKIDLKGMLKIARVLHETISYLSEKEANLSNLLVDTPTASSSSVQAGRKVSLGTVPDFNYEGKGVRATDIVKDSPAAKAGMQANDVLLSIDGQPVQGLRHFSSMLKNMDAGQVIQLEILRNEKRLSLSATLEQR